MAALAALSVLSLAASGCNKLKARDLLNKIISGLGDLALMSDQHPLLRKNLLLFRSENFR